MDGLDWAREPFRRGFPYTITCQSEGDEWTDDEVKRVANELTRLVRTGSATAPPSAPGSHEIADPVWAGKERKDPPRTRQSPLILAAFRPWGGSQDDATRGVGVHRRGILRQPEHPRRYARRHDAPARARASSAPLLTRSTAG